MKKVLFLIIALFVLCTSQAIASNGLYKYSNDDKIISALEVLQNYGIKDVFSRLDEHSVKIIFYDLSLIDFSYAKHYAISSTNENGENYILINNKYEYSPKEAVACLIAHESVHELSRATLDEEVKATKKEALTWIKLRNSAGAIKSDDLVERENNLASLYLASSPGLDLIRKKIAGNSFYQQQLAMK